MKITITDEMKQRTFMLYPHLTEDELKDIITKSKPYYFHKMNSNKICIYCHTNHVLRVPKHVAYYYTIDYEIPLFTDKNGISYTVELA